MIEIDRVRLERGGRPVLDRLDLRLAERRIGVIGANGSGKSSFARLLNGLLLPSKGHVRIGGLDTARDGKAIRRRVGFVFQNPDNQIVYPSVGEDVGFGLRARKLPKDEVARRVAAILRQHNLAHLEARLAHELSGGERQMVALAGVLVTEPELLVLDEPTTLLDLANTRRVMRAVAAADCRIVLVTHDLALLETFDRVLFFEEGRLAGDGPPAETVDRYRRSVA